MADFTPLEELLAIDFSQLRANNGRATDEAIKLFVTKLNQFFQQFENNQPNQEEQSYFQDLMDKIVDKINNSEMAYYKDKYAKDESFQSSDLTSFKITYKSLSTRMQYWAAGERFGDSIRNPDEHKKAINYLGKWPNLGKSHTSYKGPRMLSFSGIFSGERKDGYDDDQVTPLPNFNFSNS